MNIVKKSLITMITFAMFFVSSAGFAKQAADESIVDVAMAVNAATMSEEDPDGEFAVLLLALSLYPDIVDALSGKGQYTVFAPTDAAFANLEAILPLFCYTEGLVPFVLDNPDYIEEVLLYHVTKGRKDAAEVLPKDNIRMLSGDFISRIPGTLFITDALGRDANLEAVDVPADNGVIHVISEVVLPRPPASVCEA